MIEKIKSIISKKSILWYAFIFSALLCGLLGCATYKDYNCYDSIEYLNNSFCEDTTMLGYVSAFVGKEKWNEIIKSFEEDKNKNNKYQHGCGKYWGQWLGRKIYKDAQRARID